jgi:predicted O-methyltransferase YrrM
LADEIEALVDGVAGWSPLDQLFALSLLARSTAHLPGDIVEVGSWCGRSSVVLGAAARDTHGVVHCIDLFPTRDSWRRNPDGTYSFAVEIDGRVYGAYEEARVWGEPYNQQIAPRFKEHHGILEQFQATVNARRLERFVKPHRGTSATFAAGAPHSFACRFIFLDGDHSYDAVIQDLQRLAPFLVPGGWICFDDAFSGYDGVDKAITEFFGQNPAYDITRQLTRKCFAARLAPHERQNRETHLEQFREAS